MARRRPNGNSPMAGKGRMECQAECWTAARSRCRDMIRVRKCFIRAWRLSHCHKKQEQRQEDEHDDDQDFIDAMSKLARLGLGVLKRDRSFHTFEHMLLWRSGQVG